LYTFICSECTIANAPVTDGAFISETYSDSQPFFFGATLVYQCIDSVEEFDGTNVVTCQSDGFWFPDSIGTCIQASE